MEGKCLCESVRFKIAGKAPSIYQCYCSLCRKVSGAASNAATIVPASQFQWLKGDGEISQFAKNSGFKSAFCSSCGSPVPNKLNGGEHYWVPVGLLDDTEGMKVVAHLFVGSKAHWQLSENGVSQHDEMPSSKDLMALLGVKE